MSRPESPPMGIFATQIARTPLFVDGTAPADARIDPQARGFSIDRYVSARGPCLPMDRMIRVESTRPSESLALADRPLS
jgi:hypothetical protein